MGNCTDPGHSIDDTTLLSQLRVGELTHLQVQEEMEPLFASAKDLESHQ